MACRKGARRVQSMLFNQFSKRYSPENVLPSIGKERARKLTNSNDIADKTKHSHVKVAILDVGATPNERDRDGNAVAYAQADDTHARERIESRGRAEINEPR